MMLGVLRLLNFILHNGDPTNGMGVNGYPVPLSGQADLGIAGNQFATQH